MPVTKFLGNLITSSGFSSIASKDQCPGGSQGCRVSVQEDGGYVRSAWGLLH